MMILMIIVSINPIDFPIHIYNYLIHSFLYFSARSFISVLFFSCFIFMYINIIYIFKIPNRQTNKPEKKQEQSIKFTDSRGIIVLWWDSGNNSACTHTHTNTHVNWHANDNYQSHDSTEWNSDRSAIPSRSVSKRYFQRIPFKNKTKQNNRYNCYVCMYVNIYKFRNIIILFGRWRWWSHCI